VDSACLGFGPVAGCCDWCDETSGFSVTELVSHEVYTASLCNVQTFYIVSVFKKFKVLHVMQGLGRAIEEAVNSRLLTAAARIRSQVSPH
jgi:hypothetical protein